MTARGGLMTPEERFERIEREIEFIVKQQGQFSADLQQERQERREREALIQKQIDQTNAAVVAAVGMIGRLSEAQAETEAKLKEVAEGMRKLEEKGAETEERLNLFINFVERYLSQRDNGKGEKPND